MTTKLNFRARTLDASKPMSVYFAEDLPELTDLNAINRSVPAMPSGMEKEEEAEKHLQDILESQEKTSGEKKAIELYIPTPEVFVSDDADGAYKSIYKGMFKLPRAFIHVQPFSADHDLPDYDMDEEDKKFLEEVLRKQKMFEVNEITFEDMLDRLEKNSGHNVVSVKEAKLLLKEDDELILAVYDYWVDKRLRLKQPLIPTVKSDKREGGIVVSATPGSSGNTGGGGGGSGASNPYVAFRRRTEKMQTRKNRKNDEASYEKMLKLRRDLARAVTLLEMVKRREKTKKENLNLTADIFEKRFHAGDFDGKIISEVLAQRAAQMQKVLQPQHHFLKYAENWVNAQAYQQQQKRQYAKKKRHKSHRSHPHHGRSATSASANGPEFGTSLGMSSDEERSASAASPSDHEEDELEGPFAFRRKRNCQYLAPLLDDEPRGWPWDSPADGGGGEAKYRYSLASLSTPLPRCIGMVRRRVSRGGRIVLDRGYANYDDLWRSLDFTVKEGVGDSRTRCSDFDDWPHYRPVTPPHCREDPDPDPYRVRISETPVGLPTQPIKPPLVAAAAVAQQRARSTLNGLGLRTVSVDSIIAHNAASAVVNSDTLDLFSASQQPPPPSLSSVT